MSMTDAATLLCLDCARLRGMETPLALLTPHEGRCEYCGRCTLVGTRSDAGIGPDDVEGTMSDGYVPVVDYAAATGRSSWTIRRWCRSGLLDARINGHGNLEVAQVEVERAKVARAETPLVCGMCGAKYGLHWPSMPVKWKTGKCGLCGRMSTAVVEPAAFGGLHEARRGET